MGWLEGLLTGYADRNSEIRRDNAAAAEAATQREAGIYKALLDSPDPKIAATAAVGLMQTAQPNKLKGGFGGWIGQMEEHPAYAPLVKYMSTKQPVTTQTTTEPGLPSRQTQGFLAPGSVPGQQSSLAQPSTSPTQGGSMAAPQPLPGMAPGYRNPQRDPARWFGAGGPPPPEMPNMPPSLQSKQPSLPMPSGPPPAPSQGSPVSPAGFPTSPEGTTFVQQLEPPDASGSNGGHWVDDQGQHWTLSNDQILKVGEHPVAVGGPLHGGPPAIPPGLMQNVQDPHSAPLTPGAPGVTTSQTRYELPHAFPTHAESLAADEQAKMHAEISTLQEAYHTQGDPDWQKKGFDAYMQQHARGTLGVMEGDAQPVSGAVARQYNVPDGTYMQPLYNKADGTIIHWIPAADKNVGRALNADDQAAIAMGEGYRSARDVPPERYPAFQAMKNSIAKGLAAARSGGTVAGKYAEEKARVLANPGAIVYAAKGIAADLSTMGLLINNRPQAFKDAVLDYMQEHGVTPEKMSEATRTMAEMARDILPNMDMIMNDAKAVNAANMMGPIQGRWQTFLTSKLGEGDAANFLGRTVTPQEAALFAKFNSETHLLQQAVQKAHSGMRGAGSTALLDKMNDIMSANRMDLTDFLGGMSGIRPWMQTYAAHLPEWGKRGVEPEDVATPQTGGAQPDAAPTVTPTGGDAPTNEAAAAAAAFASGKKLWIAPTTKNVYINGKLAEKAGAH